MEHRHSTTALNERRHHRCRGVNIEPSPSSLLLTVNLQYMAGYLSDTIDAGIDQLTGVESKDIVISQETNLAIRIYIPKSVVPNHKLPILIYYHGGAFMTESFASSTYHPTLNLITMESNVISVSIDYRLAPEYPIPIPYEDSWEATKWVANHNGGNGPEAWLNDYADFKNVFLAGDSSGANIAHNMAIRVGLSPTNSVNDINLKGVIMLHPYFGGKDPIGEESGKDRDFKALVDLAWKLACPLHIGLDDPLFNPAMDPLISNFGCSKRLVYVGEKDKLKVRGLNYKKVMENSAWKGRVELMESKGGRHVFFLFNPSSENARILRKRICSFINPIRSKA
ncbi:alpha/Beta hydrolase fold protein [Artemisia annua]|uniref:Alpha/Beta hydrolase fold protein n=1 Tax=Artemisia annua TaxID=35608 RepID=A0A2U1NWM3_ARTAN|nr:alpha/Beta hydrolase fold protein [Artemisia annua]